MKLDKQFVFFALLKASGIPVPEAEYRITPKRKFRWDYAWPQYRLTLEVQGGIWSGGAHGRGWGIKRDMEKSNIAAMHGWRCLFCEPGDLGKTDTIEMIRLAISAQARF